MVDFRLLPGLKSASGIVRVYLQQVHPLSAHLRQPGEHRSRDAAPPFPRRAYGRRWRNRLTFLRGIAEELRPSAPASFPAKFLDAEPQSAGRQPAHVPLQLDRYQGASFYFSSVDQIRTAGKVRTDLLEIYRGIDDASATMAKAGRHQPRHTFSDHGLWRFDQNEQFPDAKDCWRSTTQQRAMPNFSRMSIGARPWRMRSG